MLPLFPLPVVLFPGTARSLHTFEPRCRRLLADCLDGDRRVARFALVRFVLEPFAHAVPSAEQRPTRHQRAGPNGRGRDAAGPAT